MRLFCFSKFGSKAGLQIHRFGGGEEGPVGRAEVQVVIFWWCRGWGGADWIHVMVLRATRNPGLAEVQEGSSPSRAAVRQRKAW